MERLRARSTRSSARGDGQVAKWGTENIDFAWDIFEKVEIKVVVVGHCVGKATVSCQEGAYKRAQQHKDPFRASSFCRIETRIRFISSKPHAPAAVEGVSTKLNSKNYLYARST